MSAHRLSPWHLERMNVESFGKLFRVSVGPFAPGMNVVFGRNESGKTTVSSFATGVLFGWPDGRSRQNTYKPENAERAGSLLFRHEDGGEALLSRTRNADGVSDEHGLLADIDEATYKTVFALDSDELLSLDDTSAVTSHLLTAGSGTAVSPARALGRIDELLARCLSRAASAEDSIANISARLQEVEAELARADEEAAGLIAESREHERLVPARAALAEKRDELNALIEGRSADLSLLQNLESQLGDLNARHGAVQARLDDAQSERQRLREQRGDASGDVIALCGLSPDEERAIRDTLEDFQVERDQLASAVDHAKRDVANSKAAYEVLEDSLEREKQRGGRSRAIGQVALSVILPVIALIAGIPTVLYGNAIQSLTIVAFGAFLVLVAFIMGAAALAVAFRAGKEGPSPQQRLEDARWVMLQDSRKLEACERELDEMGERIASYFHFNHLSQAGRSLRRARSLLDEAREMRAAASVLDQRVSGLESQLAAIDENIARVRRQRDELLDDAGVPDIAAFETLVAEAIESRRELVAKAEQMDTRAGELAQRLSQARDETAFAALKQERAALSCRLDESRATFASLLIARRNLSQAISQWESESQPKVYQLASRLFCNMTDGAWSQVRLTGAGEVQVVDPQGEPRDPLLLSLGTRQQLYLSLRIALLMTAGNVGAAVPLLADDILVNFDTRRRRSAARALLDLSQLRQVILFTCHEEVLSLVRDLDPTANVVALGES